MLGVYSSGSTLIRLHAFVFDAERLPLPREINDFYLRLHVLATLVHEVAHHHDNTQRVRRGRWLADRTENNEWYAEKMEYAWVREIVLPYLETTYPAQVKLFLDWVERFGGLRLPLEFFVGDPRTTTRDGLTRLSCDGRTAFEGWVEELPKCTDVTASRLAFAWELHYADEYDFCLQVVEKILAEDPSHTRARKCQTDTLVHLERWDEGLAIALKLLEENAANSNALWTLADIHEARKEWPQLLAVCARWKEADEANHSIHLYRAVAFCALGRDSEKEEELSRFGSLRFRRLPEETQRKRLDARRQGIFRRAGRPPKEHVESQTSHSQGPQP